MNPLLRYVLMGLVTINLLFVHITRAAGLHWLIPMYVLTFTSPVLVRYRENVWYRAGWNVAVMLIFAVLVNDATKTGILHLLEDGLVLAAFCQVHLLNNLRRLQKPDLLYFNSFLIALVTSFFSQDLAFSLLFLTYVPTLMIALQLASITSRGELVDREAYWTVVKNGVAHSVVLLLCTAVAFATVPRDFRREGFAAARLEMLRSAPTYELGFSDQVQLGRSGQTTVSNRVVMRLRLLRGLPQQVSGYFRGATFTYFSREGWHVEALIQPMRKTNQDEVWRLSERDTFYRPGHKQGPILAAEILDSSATRLFAPLETQRVRILPPGDPMLTRVKRDGTMQYAGLSRGGKDPKLRYELELFSDRMRLGPLSSKRKDVYTALRRSTVPPEAIRLARRLARQGRVSESRREKVERIRSYIANRYEYLLPGQRGATKSFEDFVNGRGGGHCEYFATTLAVMLRAVGIPCRLVTGYRSNEWDERTLIVRRKHAHAWVEVRDRRGGWYTCDATPAGSLEQAAATSLFEQVKETVSGLWTSLVGFDAAGRRRAIAWLQQVPARAMAYCADHPILSALVCLALAAAFVLWRRRRHRLVDPAVRGYLAVLNRLGLTLSAAETPRELLTRAEADLDPEDLNALEDATREHEQLRYACRPANSMPE